MTDEQSVVTSNGELDEIDSICAILAYLNDQTINWWWWNFHSLDNIRVSRQVMSCDDSLQVSCFGQQVGIPFAKFL